MNPGRITDAFDAQLRALLDLRGAQSFKEYWRSARRLLHSTLPNATVWFAPTSDLVPPSAGFWRETGLTNDSQFQRFAECHPVKAFLLANPQKPLATLSDVMTEAELSNSRFYLEFMTPVQGRFSAVLAFWHRSSLRALIGLNRSGQDRDFSPPERRTLRWLHGHLSQSLNSVWKQQRERCARGLLELLLATSPLSIVALDWDLNVLYHNRSARQSALLWIRGEEAARNLKLPGCFDMPADLVAACSEHKAAWSQSRDHRKLSSGSTSVAIAHRSLPGFQASVRVVQLETARQGMPLFMVVFESKDAPLINRLDDGTRTFSQFARLTVREREVALLVCKGASNKEIAAHLGKSALTVKSQLQSIYGKVGNVGRGKLISLMLNDNAAKKTVSGEFVPDRLPRSVQRGRSQPDGSGVRRCG